MPVTLSWEQPDTTVGENAGSARLRAYAVTTVDKRPEDGFSFDASVSTSDGSASQPGDYTQVDVTVTFSQSDFSRATVNGQRVYRAVKQIVVHVVDDSEDEPRETFTATLAYSGPTLPHLQGGAATATVTIIDDDPPVVSGDVATDYAEDGSGPVAMYTAINPQNAVITWSLSGNDRRDFSISSTGSLTFVSPPDYERPADHDADNIYRVTVQASHGTATGMLAVTVTVTNEDEAGKVTLSPAQPRVGARLTATLTDPDGKHLR